MRRGPDGIFPTRDPYTGRIGLCGGSPPDAADKEFRRASVDVEDGFQAGRAAGTAPAKAQQRPASGSRDPRPRFTDGIMKKAA